MATAPGAVGAPEAPVGSVPAQVVDVDIDQDGKPDVPLYGIDLSSRSGMSWMEQQERRRMSLRNAHAMATMTQYRIGMTHLETVTALGLVTQIELALITCFRESLPEPGQNWDSQKRARGDRAAAGAAQVGAAGAAPGGLGVEGHLEPGTGEGDTER